MPLVPHAPDGVAYMTLWDECARPAHLVVGRVVLPINERPSSLYRAWHRGKLVFSGCSLAELVTFCEGWNWRGLVACEAELDRTVKP